MAKRIGKIFLSLLIGGAIFALGWWAAREAFSSPDEAQGTPGERTLAEAREGSVGRKYTYSISIDVPTAPVATNALAGVVTSIGVTDVEPGSLLYTVGDQGVFAVEAPRPFYRDLSVGAKGQDVVALQKMLAIHGYPLAADGMFGAATENALKNFQSEAGTRATGSANLGTLVAIPSLPATVSFAEHLRPGVALAGGEEIVSAPVGEHEFHLSLNENQLEFVPVGARVTFTVGDTEFHTRVANVDAREDGSFRASLVGIDGGSVCTDQCGQLPSDGSSTVIGTVIPEEPVAGIVVPAPAVLTLSDGSTVVLMADGSERDVRVLGSGQGLVVVDGVEAGEKVVLGVEIVTENAGN